MSIVEDRENVGHKYAPLEKLHEHRKIYEAFWPEEKRKEIRKVINLMRTWDTDRCERVTTLYAAWNDFLIEGESAVTDDCIVDEVLNRWAPTKLRFTKTEWLNELKAMKQLNIIPTGFGRRTVGGMPQFPGMN